MKRDLSAREAARQMAHVMVEHLETLPARERENKIKAGQKVMKGLKKASSSVSGNQSKASSPADTSRLPLAARGH
ncbi:MAG: hypothetical protein OXB94_08385 [Nitrospira sp.]|nr:hypothetical protein [Nitrospira sp.]